MTDSGFEMSDSKKSIRRTPKQSRSKASVDAILEACAQILEREDFENITTNQIAERAGVSVGTLYQYFDDKDAVLTGVGERVVTEGLAAAAKALDAFRNNKPTLAEGVDHLLDVTFASVARPRVLRQILLRENREPPNTIWQDQTKSVVQALLYGHADLVRPGNVDIMSTILVSFIFSVLHDVVTTRPELLSTPEFRSIELWLLGGVGFLKGVPVVC